MERTSFFYLATNSAYETFLKKNSSLKLKKSFKVDPEDITLNKISKLGKAYSNLAFQLSILSLPSTFWSLKLAWY